MDPERRDAEPPVMMRRLRMEKGVTEIPIQHRRRSVPHRGTRFSPTADLVEAVVRSEID
jgi:hypothetical protein